MCFEENSKWRKIYDKQMGVAYMHRCVMSQGIQGKGNCHFMSYGSRVTGQKVKRAIIAPP